MPFSIRSRRFAGATLVGVSLVGAATAAARFSAAQTTVNCAQKVPTPCVSAANTSSGIGVLGSSNTGAGVTGTSTTNYGIKSTSTSNYGIFGQAKDGFAGVSGFTTGTTGVRGIGGAIGVSGFSPEGFGLYGNAATAGVYGLAARGDGAHVRSSKNSGLDAFSESGRAISAVGLGANPAVLAVGPWGLEGIAPTSGFPLRLTDDRGNVVFFVDGVGNVQTAGNIRAAARTASGATATAFTPKAALPTVEDSGTAQLVGGTAVVRLDPTFAASIDATAGYRVFVTPYGDSRGIFVATTARDAFAVRESGGGRTTLSFDYRIVATARGQAGRRMALTVAAQRIALPPDRPLTQPARLVVPPLPSP